MVDDQADTVTPIAPEDMKASIIHALRAADKRAVDRLYERLCEIADAHEHADRTDTGIVLFSNEGKRLCDWSAGTDGETGELRVFCQPVWGYQPKTGHWRLSSCRSLDGWLKALDAEFDSSGTR